MELGSSQDRPGSVHPRARTTTGHLHRIVRASGASLLRVPGEHLALPRHAAAAGANAEGEPTTKGLTSRRTTTSPLALSSMPHGISTATSYSPTVRHHTKGDGVGLTVDLSTICRDVSLQADASKQGRDQMALRHVVWEVYAERRALHRHPGRRRPGQGHQGTAEERALPYRVSQERGRQSFAAPTTRGGRTSLCPTRSFGTHSARSSRATTTRPTRENGRRPQLRPERQPHDRRRRCRTASRIS